MIVSKIMIHNHVLKFIGHRARTNADAADPLLNPSSTHQSHNKLSVTHLLIMQRHPSAVGRADTCHCLVRTQESGERLRSKRSWRGLSEQTVISHSWPLFHQFVLVKRGISGHRCRAEDALDMFWHDHAAPSRLWGKRVKKNHDALPSAGQTGRLHPHTAKTWHVLLKGKQMFIFH